MTLKTLIGMVVLAAGFVGCSSSAEDLFEDSPPFKIGTDGGGGTGEAGSDSGTGGTGPSTTTGGGQGSAGGGGSGAGGEGAGSGGSGPTTTTTTTTSTSTGCVPEACPGVPYCGLWPDGCGGFSQCNFDCGPGNECGDDNLCHSCPVDQPALCAAAGAECGALDVVVCGQTVTIGCGSPQTACGTLEQCVGNECVGCTLGGIDVCGPGEAKPHEWTCPATYSNGIQDGSETDVDCGGPYHPRKCPVGDSCQQNSDCVSSACSAGQCANSNFPQQVSCDWYGNAQVYCCPFNQ